VFLIHQNMVSQNATQVTPRENIDGGKIPGKVGCAVAGHHAINFDMTCSCFAGKEADRVMGACDFLILC